MRIASNLMLVGALVALAAACGGKIPGGVPGGDKIKGAQDKMPPGVGGNDAMLDPNACGGYASSDAGRKLKAFLQATQDLEKATIETADVVKQSCITMGNKLGYTDADYSGKEGKDICAMVYGRLNDNLKVAFKGQAALKVKYKPATCTVDVSGSVSAAASCEAKGSADIGATCNGTCDGKCNGTASKGECKGKCEGKCDGYANVDASAQCQAAAEVKASVDVKCTKPELSIEADAKLVVDKAKAEQTLAAMREALPEILSVKARLVPMKHAVETWAKSAVELKDSAISLANNFKDQAKCVTGQIYAAAKMTANIQANVSFSVEVSASASGSIGSK